MKSYFGYIRVSTAKQGEHGVSLQEQREAIVHFAERNGLSVIAWFEERETAAKRGRRVFTEMLRRLRSANQADGVIMHKIDRSARNLKDWAELGNLVEQGVDILFTSESLDLRTRGGRLSADIQAVVAADYIRNLREETRKGFYGRLKQGFYPLPAPLGYLDRGGGKPKDVDPVSGPLVRRAFELYETGRYSLDGLVDKLFGLGLRNRRGRKVTRTGVSNLLNNPFYIGLIHLNSSNETFSGAHPPLVSKSLFERVRAQLQGKTQHRATCHRYLFRRLLSCGNCGYSLIGERQKGHVYYRCHTKTCPTSCIREEYIDKLLRDLMGSICFNHEAMEYFQQKVLQIRTDWGKEQEALQEATHLQLAQIQIRLDRLTDAYLDRLLDKELFEERKTRLLMERRELEERDATLKGDNQAIPERLSKFLELAKTALLGYESGNPEEKRELIQIITSNRTVDGKNVYFKLSFPFDEVAKEHKNANGDPYRDEPRTLDKLFRALLKLAMQDRLPKLSELVTES